MALCLGHPVSEVTMMPHSYASLSRARNGLILLLSLLATLAVEAWAGRRAWACGEPEIDYGPEKPVVRSHRGQREIRLNYRRKEHSFAGGNLTFAEIRVYTRDVGLMAWLEKHGMGDAMWAQLKAASNRTTCVDLADGRRIQRLEQMLSARVIQAYRQDTRRVAPRPDLMLVAEVLDQSEPSCSPPAP